MDAEGSIIEDGKNLMGVLTVAKKRRKKRRYVVINWGITAPLVLLIVATILLIMGISKACSNRALRAEAAGTPEPTAMPEPTRSPIPVVVDYESVHSTWIKVWFDDTGELRDMLLEEYLFGVVAAEVPASYSMEALKAQTVAARTYSLYSISHGGCNTNSDADICTSSSCCQAYRTEEQLKERWGEEYAYYHSCIDKALMDTAGEVLLYNNKPIDAMYHASSGGYTENSENVYANEIPYLRSVESPHEVGSRLSGEKTYTLADFVAAANGARPDANLTVETIGEQVKILSTYPSGRVEKMQLGNVEITGKQARKMFSLDSAMFTLEITDTEITFYTKGFGHGVGMSQSGANGMALEGADYKTILLHYYTGVTLGVIGQY